jgi:uncharacterized protein YndB with AHSA1/START domain
MTKENEMLQTRILNAPPELVWKVWTDPKHMAIWWGPKGFSNPVCQVDARPGGIIYIEMKGPDGILYPMRGTFREVIKPERIVFINSALDESGNPLFEVLNTITFANEGGKTKLTIHAVVSKITPQAKRHLDGMHEGWSQMLDRLGNYLTQL